MKLRYIMAAFIVACIGTGCDDKLETFEPQGDMGAPTTVEEITSEALPGQIHLTWNVPENAQFSYMKIWYNDPLSKETIYNVVSKGTFELVIDDTRARFGDYEIFYQTFNANNEGGEIKSIKAQSGIAPVVVTESRKEVKLSVNQLSTNAQEPSEGPIANLVNGNTNDFFHTRWSSPQIPLPHYIQIDFNEEHQIFALEWWNRVGGNSDGFPTVAELQISNDGNDWETVETLSGFAASSGAHVTTEYVDAGKPFTHFRFNVTSTTQNSSYFHMAEFKFYDVELDVYDPETVELD